MRVAYRRMRVEARGRIQAVRLRARGRHYAVGCGPSLGVLRAGGIRVVGELGLPVVSTNGPPPLPRRPRLDRPRPDPRRSSPPPRPRRRAGSPGRLWSATPKNARSSSSSRTARACDPPRTVDRGARRVLTAHRLLRSLLQPASSRPASSRPLRRSSSAAGFFATFAGVLAAPSSRPASSRAPWLLLLRGRLLRGRLGRASSRPCSWSSSPPSAASLPLQRASPSLAAGGAAAFFVSVFFGSSSWSLPCPHPRITAARVRASRSRRCASRRRSARRVRQRPYLSARPRIAASDPTSERLTFGLFALRGWRRRPA